MRAALTLAVTVVLVVVSGGAALLLTRAVRADTAEVTSSGPGLSGAERAVTQTRKILDLPSSWVAFSAKVRVFSPDMNRVEGRLFRSSDGSTRLETGPPGEEPRTIDIKNVPTSTHYLLLYSRRTAAAWTSAPMDVPEYGGQKPVGRFADQAGLTRYRYRLSFRRGDEPSVFAKEGFEVYQYVDVGGNVHLQAPALNMLDLVNQSITGRREEVYDVALEEPDPSLFLPPADAVVTHQAETRGKKLVPRGEHKPHR